MVQHLLQRRGAARIALIPAEVLEALNEGLLPTVHLNEFLALDLPRLARNVARQVGLDPQAERLQDTLAMLGAFKPVARHAHVARALYDLTAARPERDAIAQALASHASDVARCWAAQWVGFSGLALAQQLQAVRPFAADAHFGVREMAWTAVREAVARASRWATGSTTPAARDPSGCGRCASAGHANRPPSKPSSSSVGHFAPSTGRPQVEPFARNNMQRERPMNEAGLAPASFI